MKERKGNFITIFIIVILIILFILAFYWEYKDYKRIERQKNVYEITDPIEKEKAYIFYSTFCYENNISWRSNYILATVSIIIIYFLLHTAKINLSMEMSILIMIVIFLVYFLGDNFRSFHFWRVLASKTKPEMAIL
jgi:hypothetical protein